MKVALLQQYLFSDVNELLPVFTYVLTDLGEMRHKKSPHSGFQDNGAM